VCGISLIGPGHLGADRKRVHLRSEFEVVDFDGARAMSAADACRNETASVRARSASTMIAENCET